MDLKEKIKSMIAEMKTLPCFEELFVYGIMAGIALFLAFLMGLQGFNCSLENYQVHAYTLFWIDMIWLLAYHALGSRGLSKVKRLFVSMSIAVFAFEIHDNLWVASTLFRMDKLLLTDVGTVFIASRDFYVAKFSRNMILTVSSFLFARKHFNYSLMTIYLIAADLIYWASMVYLGWIYEFPTFVVTFFMGLLPLIGLLFKEK